MLDKTPIDVKLLIFNHFNKKELKRLERVNKEFKILANDKRLEANKSYNLLIREISKKILELSPIQKNRNIDRFSRYFEYKINIHTDFSVLKSHISALLNIMELYEEVFDAKLSKTFPNAFKGFNELVKKSNELDKSGKQSLIFSTHKDLENMIKYLKKSNNPILQLISKLINLMINVKPSLYKIEPVDERPYQSPGMLPMN